MFFINTTRIILGYENLVRNSQEIKFNPVISSFVFSSRSKLDFNIKRIREQLDKIDYSRSKRGLINGLGSLVKFVSGNLDDNDLQIINRNLERLHQNNKIEMEKINQFTVFANHVSKRFEEETKIINQNIFETKQFMERLEDIVDAQIAFQNEINHSEQLLNVLLMIERTISLAFQEIPNLEIITHEELVKIHTFLETIYSSEQLIPFNTKFSFKQLEVAKLSVFCTSQTINFLLKIPILKPHLASYFQMLPVPNSQDIFTIPPKKYFIKMGNTELWTDEHCQKTTPTFLCYQQPVQEACSLEKLNQCVSAKATNDYEIVYMLQNSQLLAISKNNREVIEDCHGLLTRHSISGSNLISSPCRLIIGTFIYANTTPVYEIQIPEITSVQNFSKKLHLELKHLTSPNIIHKDAIHLSLDNTVDSGTVLHYSLSITSWICLFVLVVLIIKYRKRIHDLFCKPRTIIHVQSTTNPSMEQPLNEVVQS